MQEGFGIIRTLFFDTYALVEIAKGNPNYDNYKNIRIVTSDFNLVELYYILLKINYEKTDEYYKELSDFSIKLAFDIVKKAMIFRHKNRQLNLSYADCMGYIMAKEYNIKFLTGDKEFEKMENVEFVK